MLISVSWIVDTCRCKELLGKWKNFLESIWSSANVSFEVSAHMGGEVWFVLISSLFFFNIKPLNKDLRAAGGLFFVF